MKKVLFLAALLLSLAPGAQAADINVDPGLGTLNAAVTAAADGDTLFLRDGSYRMLGMTISKSLTIKAQTNNNPVIVPEFGTNGAHRSVLIGNANSEISIAFVGVTLSAI